LNLALCHEQEARLARSWSEFKEAMAVARGDSRRDRENEATTHVSALEPRLSRLTLVTPVVIVPPPRVAAPAAAPTSTAEATAARLRWGGVATATGGAVVTGIGGGF
jgi:hypothetical protein